MIIKGKPLIHILPPEKLSVTLTFEPVTFKMSFVSHRLAEA